MNEHEPLVSIIIPVYNEEKTVGNIIKRTKRSMALLGFSYEVIVVDDCSVDRSAEIAVELSAQVLKEAKHHGKGFMLRLGFRHAMGKFVVTIDSDGSHQPEEIKSVLDPLIKNKAEFVIGSRFLRKNTAKTKIPPINSVGLRFFNGLIRALTGAIVSDSQSGFRAIKSSFAKNMKLRSSGYEVESEMLIKALKIPCRIIEVPITFQQRTVGKSKLDPVKDGIRILFSILESYLF